MTNNCIFVTHATLDLNHAETSLKYLLSEQNEKTVGDNFIIYNTHESEVATKDILNLIAKYNKQIIKNIFEFPYDETKSKKTLTQDLANGFSILNNSVLKNNGRTLILKSDYALSTQFNRCFNDMLDTGKLMGSLPIYNAKQKVPIELIDERLHICPFKPVLPDTYYRGGSNTPITPKEEISPNGEKDYHPSINFVSHNIVHDFNLHVFTNDVIPIGDSVSDVMGKDATWGGCIEFFRALQATGVKYHPEIRAFGVHLYHGIISENRKEDRTDVRKIVDGERY